MRSDWAAYSSKDFQRAVVVKRHPTATFEQLILGTASDGIDLSPYISSCQQSPAEVALTVNWYQELYDASQPAPGELIAVSLDTRPFWYGVITELADYREARGERLLRITARSRDAHPLWRNDRWVGPIYPAGSDLGVMAKDVARGLGLSAAEISITPIGIPCPHSSTQLADMTAWDMLETLLLPAGLEPFVDALGRLKTIRRDTDRVADAVLAMERVVRIKGSRSRPAISTLRLKWLDPNLSKSLQQDQKLAAAEITAGFFKLEQKRKVYWSDDRRQRADATYMKILQSVNDALLPVGEEEYDPLDQYSGKITVTTYFWVPTLATVSIAAILSASHLPDYAPPSGGPTVPTGKIVHGAAEIALLLVMLSLGTGSYEVWGQPFDYIHATNTTEAYDSGASDWERAEEEIQSDLIRDEAHAQAVAVRELLYRAYSGTRWGAEIVDHPGIEPGDIIELPDGARLYVTDYQRNLTRGAEAVLTVEGFRC